MLLKELAKQAFGRKDEECVARFLREKGFDRCNNDTAQYNLLQEKCKQWKKEILLWDSNTFIYGINGWNFYITVCRMTLPKQKGNWIEYLYYMALLTLVNNWDINDWNILIEHGDNNFDIFQWDFDIDSYVELNKEQWLNELKCYREQSWERYKKYKKSHKEYIKYDESMKKNYPEYDVILEYLVQNTKECDVVRMNSDADNVIWYFAKDADSFYVTYISDCM